MAELAFGIIGNVIEKLGFVAYQEFCLAWGFKSDLEKLQHTMSIIKVVLLDAEKKQASDPLLRLWIGQLNDVLYDAEDVLEEIEYQALRKQVVATYGSTSTKVRHFFSSSITRAFPFKLAHKIKGIRERLDAINAEKDQFKLMTIIHGDAHVMHPLRDIDSISFVQPSTVIGRGKDQKKIINLLMHPDGNKNVNVISIVGLGGLGKTALAKLVYNDEQVVRLFQLRMWVCVSEDFSVTRLIKEILKSACGTIDPNWNVDALQTKLRDVLRDTKFLLVLDDVWNDDHNKWIGLRDLLIGGCKGSKIIVTTRSNSVASAMETDSTYSLEGLSQEDCLSLFVKCALKEGEENQHPNLLKIGKEIVEKCKGVPLAVRTLGSLLYSKVDEHEWEFVRDNEIWKLKQKERDILPALQLSYDQMPIHLKRCFSFCSIFPKDYIFYSDTLIHMWMAHGLLLETSLNKKQKLKDVGDLYINELLSRSFFQDVDKLLPCFPLYTFKMHDLIHDLAISVAQGECSVVDLGNKDISGTIRHLLFSVEDLSQEVPKCLDKLTKVRTVRFTAELPVPLVEACIFRFKYLRLLDLSESSFEVLPSSIGTLKHLRNLDLSNNNRIKLLPNSIVKLHKLQTLVLLGCSELERLPKDIRNMIGLQRLSVTTKYTCLLENGSLNSLQFLDVIGCSRLEVLFHEIDSQCLTNLRTLMIGGCESLTSLSLNIKHLTALEFILISDCPSLNLMGGGEDNQDLKLSLQTLLIEGSLMLEVLPQWLQRSANTLQYLHIVGCENITALPEWLPILKSLHTLVIQYCPKLSSLPEGTHHLTALRKLEIRGCPKLSRKCKREDQSKVAHVREIELDDDTRSTSTEEEDDQLPCHEFRMHA
ncbi:putative disease resistance protein RGA3 [Corylus avellana]|uniref:putative disease resistance protein RGA3 n=1 Tax=Corylus avellana TaxID=13451 RepID=UPI00286C78D4|nr:putative disease resistance protein RGA3 [Corylus avellana]